MHEMPLEASMMPALPASFALGRVPPPPSYTSRTAAGGKLKLRVDALANAAVFSYYCLFYHTAATAIATAVADCSLPITIIAS